MIKATGEAVLYKTPLSVAFSLQKLLWHNYMFYFFIVNMFFEICYFNTITNSDECALAHSGAVYAPLRSVLCKRPLDVLHPSD